MSVAEALLISMEGYGQHAFGNNKKKKVERSSARGEGEVISERGTTI
jgi:hypothetical protein